MFKDFFTRQYYGNTMGAYLLTALIIIGSIIAGRLLYWLIGKTVKRLAAKTKTRFDDILVDMFEEPLVFALIITGMWYALSLLKQTESAHLFIEKIYYVLIIFNVTWLITRFIDALIQEYLVPVVNKSESNLDDQLLPVVRKGIKLAIWIIAVIVALNNAGYDVGALLAGLGIGGLAFALAAQDTVANLFGSLAIFVDRPFLVNDRVITNGYEGYVQEVGIRSTRLKTLAGRIITIPNSEIYKKPIENVTSEPSRKIIQQIRIPNNYSIEKVETALRIMREVVVCCPKTENRVIATIGNFNDFCIGLSYIFYVNKEGDPDVTPGEVLVDVLRRFQENSIELATPLTMYKDVNE